MTKPSASLLIVSLFSIILINSCFEQEINKPHAEGSPVPSLYGTLEPFAGESVYFLMTDRFVDGDSSNNQVDQGGNFPTFWGELKSETGESAFVGYMGGDFKGIISNAKYIKDMGFTAIWLTPIVDNPDEAFSGGEAINFGGAFKDGNKTGYHGYWGSNFFIVDEHLPSKDLPFKELTNSLKINFGIKTVLDIVLNHGSPAFSMPQQQNKFGQLFDADNQLIADHQNLSPSDLDDNNSLHKFYNKKTEIVQLSDINENNPETLAYFTSAYLHWIEQGADAFRIDTIKHMPHAYWKKFSDNIRENHPNFFMFAESYSFDANFIAEHTYPQNGSVSVLDFPGREALINVFEKNMPYSEVLSYLHLDDALYQNPYELMTFYDNHDMSRMNATDSGFIDAHNWLFTSRGIPIIYYGSEIGFMRGKNEHAGNRNYFGQNNIDSAPSNSIHQSLTSIATLRKNNISLQKGIQINLDFTQDTAAFYRVYQHEGVFQTALVLLNKSDQEKSVEIKKYLSEGIWENAFNNEKITLAGDKSISSQLNPHSVEVYFLNQANSNSALIERTHQLMASQGRK